MDLPFYDQGNREGEGSASRPGRSLPPVKTRYPLYSRLGGPHGRTGHVRKNSPHQNSIPGYTMDCSIIIFNCCKYVVLKTNSRKHFIMDVLLNYVNCRGSSFMEQNSATQRHSLVELQFCCHVNTSAVAPIVIRSGTGCVTFLACYRKFLQSHSGIHI